MRILITTFTFHPQTNGVASVTGKHVAGFIDRGHEVTVATGFDPRRDPQPSGPLQVRQFHVQGSAHLRVGCSGQTEQYRSFVRNYDGDFIISHCWQTWSTDLLLPILPKLKPKKILISHGIGAHRYPLNARFPRGFLTWIGWAPYVRKLTRNLRAFDWVVFPTDTPNRGVYYDHLMARQIGLPSHSVIPNGASAENPALIKMDFRSVYDLGDKVLLLCVASYDSLKNQQMVLEAFLSAQLQNAVLVFIGTERNDYLEKLQSHFQKTKLRGEKSEVLFLAAVGPETLQAAYQSADLFVYGSQWESGPLVILDALACGVPFVSTSVGFVPSLPGGLAVKSAAEMRDAIVKLVGDDDLRRKLGEQGRQICRTKFNWPLIQDQYEALLKQVGDKRQQTGGESIIPGPKKLF